MNTVVSLLALAIAVAAVVYAFTRQSQSNPPQGQPMVDTATLKNEMSADLARTVQATVNETLTNAMQVLGNQARHDRDEAIKLATEKITAAGSEQLGTRAQVIDESLKGITNQMNERITALTQELNRLREINSTQNEGIEKALVSLVRGTDNLKEILSSSQKRGAWGERVVEDMLRAAGFVENVNYQKQSTNETGGRPDYKFMMPPNRVLFMDVKFPHDKYAEFVTAETDAVRLQARADFVKAIKGHVDALAKRDYINNAKEEAVDLVLMFLPIESITGFIHEADPTLLDYALSKKVLLCSPLTLYSFLVVIRQATDSFHTEQTAASIMQQINKFDIEWKKYVGAVDDVKSAVDKLGEKIDDISTGGTRFKKLSVPIRDIEKLRKQQGVPELQSGDQFELPAGDDE
jgi:DNA recombination protein RmuC